MLARVSTVAMIVLMLVGGVVAALGATAGISSMAAPLDRASALQSRSYDVVHGELRKHEVWRDVEWRIAGVDAAPMTAERDDALAKRAGHQVIGLVHDDELIALELPGGDRILRSEVGWASVVTTGVYVFLALLVAVTLLGLLAGLLGDRLSRTPVWVRGVVATTPFVLAGVVRGHLRSGEMVKADLVVVLPLVLLAVACFTVVPRWYAAARTYAHEDPFAHDDPVAHP